MRKKKKAELVEILFERWMSREFNARAEVIDIIKTRRSRAKATALGIRLALLLLMVDPEGGEVSKFLLLLEKEN